MKWFLENLQGKAKKPVSSVTPQDVENYLTWRLKSGVANKTAIVDIKIIKIAFRRAENDGTILKNPVVTVRLPKEDSSEWEVFTQEEIQKLLKASPTLEWQTLILLGYFIGARLSDCVQMKWENVLPEGGVINYQQKKNRQARHRADAFPCHQTPRIHGHFWNHRLFVSQAGGPGIRW